MYDAHQVLNFLRKQEMKGKNKTVHPSAMEQEKKIKSRLQSLHARCNAVNKQAKEALIDVFCTDFEQMSARDR